MDQVSRGVVFFSIDRSTINPWYKLCVCGTVDLLQQFVDCSVQTVESHHGVFITTLFALTSPDQTFPCDLSH